MLGMALEGGGAKGAYHLGVYKAFIENGYQFDGVVGTSIGAINGALIAQGNWEQAYHLWENELTNALVLDIDDSYISNLLSNKADETFQYFKTKLKDFIVTKGIDTSNIRLLLEKYIHEDQLRNSPMDFGLATLSVSDLKPLMLFKKDIPYGKMHEYIMASASLPGFQPNTIDNKIFLDGGVYDNCPINMLIDQGYDTIYAVHTFGIGVKRKIKKSTAKIINIIPSDDTGKTLNFNLETSQYNLKMGYYDALRIIHNYSGKKYCFYPVSEKEIFKRLLKITPHQLEKFPNVFAGYSTNGYRLLFEKVLPFLATKLKVKRAEGYKELVLAAVEHKANRINIDRFSVYSFDDILSLVKGVPFVPTGNRVNDCIDYFIHIL